MQTCSKCRRCAKTWKLHAIHPSVFQTEWYLPCKSRDYLFAGCIVTVAVTALCKIARMPHWDPTVQGYVYPAGATCQNTDLNGTFFPQEYCDPGYAVVHEEALPSGYKVIGGMTIQQAKVSCCERAKVHSCSHCSS